MYSVISGGCTARHPKSFKMSRPLGLNCYVLLILKTPAIFTISDREMPTKPGSAIIIPPDTPYAYHNPSGGYIDDWLHFMPANPDIFERDFPFTSIPFLINNTDNYSSLLRQVLWENSYSDSSYKAENVNSLFKVLLNHLSYDYNHIKKDSSVIPFSSKLYEIRLELSNSVGDNHSIKKYAHAIGISESYFQHLYSALFGISFQKDLIRMRIEHAKDILLTTDICVEQIALMCGYNNDVHFYRQFKEFTGSTPAAFRNKV